MTEHDRWQRWIEHGAVGGVSRRRFLLAGTAGVAGLVAARRAWPQDEPGVTRPLRERVLLRGGTVLTLDRDQTQVDMQLSHICGESVPDMRTLRLVISGGEAMLAR